MLQPAQKKMAVIFWVVALLNTVAIAANLPLLQMATKPLLIPLLALLLLSFQSITSGKNLLLIGLFFSWMGDVFLMFDYKNPLFFIFGLASFLTTHILYIVFFLRIKSAEISILKKQPWLALLVVAYGFTLVWFLYPNLKDLKVPVIIYAMVICTMLLCSVHVFYKVNRKAARYYLAGAAAFVISDSLLAINKFYQPFAFAGVLIMLTYCAAQYFIVRGFISQQTPYDK
jgi:uncharacterized membrane protein YhhN